MSSRRASPLENSETDSPEEILSEVVHFKHGHRFQRQRVIDGDVELAPSEHRLEIEDYAHGTAMTRQVQCAKNMMGIPEKTFILSSIIPPVWLQWPRTRIVGRLWAPAVIVMHHPDATLDELRAWACKSFPEVEDLSEMGEHARTWRRVQSRLNK
jgi:hypothetical protein